MGCAVGCSARGGDGSHRLLATALREFPNETNETLVRSIGSRSAVALHDYLSDAALESGRIHLKR